MATREGFDDRWPSFDPAGRFLYFTSSRVFDPVNDTHFHDYSFPTGTRPHLLTLRADVASPFDPAQRAHRAPGAPPPLDGPAKDDKEDKDGQDEAKKNAEPEPVAIDLDGITSRVVAFPQPAGRYGPVVGAKNRVFTLSFPVRGALGSDKPGGGRLGRL